MSAKKTRKKSPAKPLPVSQVDPVTIEMYEIRFKDLLEKAEKAKEKVKFIELEKTELTHQHSKLLAEKQDIVEFLRIELGNHLNNITRLEKQINALEQEKIIQTKITQTDLESREQQSSMEKGAMNLKITKLTNEINDLQDFRGRKEAMEKEILDLKSELQAKEAKFKFDMANMEKKNLQEKHVLRKEMIMNVNEAVTCYRRAADANMDDTTKRAIRENLSVTSQLLKMASNTTELLEENKQLKTINAKLKTENSLLQDEQKQLVLSNISAKKVVEKLMAKYSQVESFLPQMDVFVQDYRIKAEEADGFRENYDEVTRDLRKYERTCSALSNLLMKYYQDAENSLQILTRFTHDLKSKAIILTFYKPNRTVSAVGRSKSVPSRESFRIIPPTLSQDIIPRIPVPFIYINKTT